MTILFIRHAKAVERSEWKKSDMQRPLCTEGIKKAEDFFKKLPLLYQSIDMIATSEAVRAKETAKLLYKHYPKAHLLKTPLLNPGANLENFAQLVLELKENRIIAVVGHEPDFSTIISALVADCPVSLDIKKASVIEIDLALPLKGELKAMIPPSLLKGLL